MRDCKIKSRYYGILIGFDHTFRHVLSHTTALIPTAFAIVAIVTTREDVVLASEKIAGVAIGVGLRVVNEAKSV